MFHFLPSFLSSLSFPPFTPGLLPYNLLLPACTSSTDGPALIHPSLCRRRRRGNGVLLVRKRSRLGPADLKLNLFIILSSSARFPSDQERPGRSSGWELQTNVELMVSRSALPISPTSFHRPHLYDPCHARSPVYTGCVGHCGVVKRLDLWTRRPGNVVSSLFHCLCC